MRRVFSFSVSSLTVLEVVFISQHCSFIARIWSALRPRTAAVPPPPEGVCPGVALAGLDEEERGCTADRGLGRPDDAPECGLESRRPRGPKLSVDGMGAGGLP
mmetsp:Transcript_23631/g.55078  ORF Transcript_23631/g.55078 Transcript_23631/m.55078 type:complete len:103 (-) Transcript_23631:140-448(-)